MDLINSLDKTARKFNPAEWPIGAYGWHQEPAFD